MSRRVSLPGADELFRRTEAREADAPRSHPTLAAAPPPVDTASVDTAAVDTAAVETAEPADDSTVTGAARPAEARDSTPEPTSRAQPAVPSPAPAPSARRTASGRVKHDEKMTVYVTADELMELEHARLVLRRTVGSAVDRGRVVRAAVAMALADLDAHGADSELVRRLSDT